MTSFFIVSSKSTRAITFVAELLVVENVNKCLNDLHVHVALFRQGFEPRTPVCKTSIFQTTFKKVRFRQTIKTWVLRNLKFFIKASNIHHQNLSDCI